MGRIRRSGNDENAINELVSRGQARQRFANSFTAFSGSTFWSNLIRTVLTNRTIAGPNGAFVKIHTGLVDSITAHANRAPVELGAPATAPEFVFPVVEKATPKGWGPIPYRLTVAIEDLLRLNDEAFLGLRVFVGETLVISGEAIAQLAGNQETLLIFDTAMAQVRIMPSVFDALRISDLATASVVTEISKNETMRVVDTPMVDVKIQIPVFNNLRVSDTTDAAIRISFAKSDLLALADAGVANVRIATAVNDDLMLDDEGAGNLRIAAISSEVLRLGTPTPTVGIGLPPALTIPGAADALNLDDLATASMGLPVKLEVSGIVDQLRLGTPTPTMSLSLPVKLTPATITDRLKVATPNPTIVLGTAGGLLVDKSGAESLQLDDGVTAFLLPLVTVEATTPTAAKLGSVNGVFTITRTGSTAASLVVKYSMTGTATDTTDYDHLSGSVTISAGNATATVTVDPILDSASTSWEETAILTIDTDVAYTVGSPSSATVTIDCNLITNGSFTADAASWTLDSGATRETSGGVGNSPYVKFHDATESALQAAIPMPASKNFKVAFSKKLLSGTEDRISLDVYFKKADETDSKDPESLAAWITATSEWVASEHSFSSGTNCAHLHLLLYPYYTGTPVIGIDDIRIWRTP